MLLPPFVGPLLRWLAERFPNALSQLVYTLLYAIVLAFIIRGLVMLGGYLDFRYAYLLRSRGEAPTDAQRFAGSCLDALLKWAPRALLVLALLTAIWACFVPLRLSAGSTSPPWLVQIVDGWEQGVLMRIGAPPLELPVVAATQEPAAISAPPVVPQIRHHHHRR